MTQKNPPGYPLPGGELGEDEIVCQLVYLPDRPEYWQALLAAIHYFTTWRAWERDTDKRGKDAAKNWRAAFELTIGCWRMTCLEDLTQSVDDILELLQTKKDCCDDNITYMPVDDIETDIIPNDGEPPEFYGETEVADWDEWNEYLCFSANKYVDYLAHVGDNLLQSVVTGSVVIGLIAGGLALLAASGIGLPIAFTIAAAITSGIVLSATLLTFEDTEEEIEEARDDIVCAILQGRSLSDAVENALSSNTAWDLFYQWIQYDDAIAIMYEGGYEGQYLEAVKDDSCECLCLHFFSADETNNPVIYQNASGCQFQMKSHAAYGQDAVIDGNFRFNYDGGGLCGPLKVIDSVVVSDALDFTRFFLVHEGVEQTDWGPDPDFGCNYALSLIEDEKTKFMYIHRGDVDTGGCTVGDITITLTYHDDDG